MNGTGLIYLRRRRLSHWLGRHIDHLRLIFDFWSTVIYAFALAVFGPGVYLYWRNPPTLPEGGVTLLGYWPAAALVFAWLWAVGQGILLASGRSPLPFHRADLHLLLPSPLDRRLVLAERFFLGWWQRFSLPSGLVLLFAGLTAGYRAVGCLQVGYLLLALAPLALGALGLSVAVFSLGPAVARVLLWLRRAGQVLGLVLFGLSFLAYGSVPGRVSPPMVAPHLPPLNLAGAVWPALLFAALALVLCWALAGRRDLALWAGASPDGAECGSARHFRSSAAYPLTGPWVYGWKYLTVMRKGTVWEWLNQFLLPVAGAVGIALAGQTAGVIAVSFAGLALLRAAVFLARPLGQELERIGRVRTLPVRMDHFLQGMLAPQAVLLLVPSLLVWLAMGAGWVALVGAPATAVALTVLAFQHHWSKATAQVPTGQMGPNDGLFAYMALVLVVLAGEQLLRTAPGAATLALLSLLVAGGAVALAIKVRTELLVA